MLSSLQIQNYRSLKQIIIPKLSSINIVTGRNGCGKSSVLEAVFLNCAGANPNAAMVVASLRGDALVSNRDDSMLRAFYFDLDPKNSIEISSNIVALLKSKQRLVRIEASYSRDVVPGVSLSEQTISGLTTTLEAKNRKQIGKISFRFEQQLQGVGIPQMPPVQFEQPTDPIDFIMAHYVSPYQNDPYAEVHQQLVQALKKKQLDLVLDAIRLVAPKVKGILPVSEMGQPRIYVDTGGNRLLPISALGSGFLHVLRLALSSATIDDGVLLLDELEDGLHFSIFPQIAEYLMSIVEQKRVQIFVATHSEEFIRAFASEAKKRNFLNYELLNMSKASSGGEIITLDREDVEYAIDANAELRA